MIYFLCSESDWVESPLTGIPILPSYNQREHILFTVGLPSLACSIMSLYILEISALSTLIPSFFFSDDPLFSLLYLWTHWRHPEFSVSSGSHKEDLILVPTTPCFHVFGVYWHWGLHSVLLANLSSSQLWAKENVLGKGTFPASLSWNGWESEFCHFASHCCHGLNSTTRWINLQT